jgi:four helix bundle protein
MRDYTKIEAWKLADDLTVALYEQTRSFPRNEVYGLTSQLRRASYSVAANIVEGSSRESKKDYLHFLYIARGSLSETQYFIHLARRLGYLSEDAAARLNEMVKPTFACLHGLTRAVEKEAGKFSKVVASLTSLLVLGAAHWLIVRGQYSVVGSRRSVVRGQWSRVTI